MNARIHMRRRTAVVAGGLLGTALLAVTTAVSLGGFSSTIVNPTNTFSSGTVVLSETAGVTTCDSTGGTNSISSTNSANCTIDDLGAPINQGPGSPVNNQVLTLKNVGTINGSTFTVTGGVCTAVPATNTNGYNGTDNSGFCGKVNVTIEDDTVVGTPACLYPAGPGACATPTTAKNLATLNAVSVPLGALNAGATRTLKITTLIDGSANNTDQGLKANIPLTWNLNQ